MESVNKLINGAFAKVLSSYVIYDHPADNPEKYVCVKWDAIDGELVRDEVLFVTDNLAFIRASLQQMGLHNLGNRMETDPAILEVWM